MNQTRIKVSDYYEKPIYYYGMSRGIFNALQKAWLADQEYAMVNETEYQAMLYSYNKKNIINQ